MLQHNKLKENSMSTTIRISDDVLAYLKKHGEFPESWNDVLRRRLIDFDTKVLKFKKAPGILPHPQEFFRRPLLKVLLLGNNHELSRLNAFKGISEIVNISLGDQIVHKGGDVRWKNNVSWMRKKLVDIGQIYPSNEVPKGIWKLTPKGIKIARRIESKKI